MAMKVGCFAVVDPFSTFEHQLRRIRDMGFRYADVTENNDGGTLGTEYGFTASVSLDANPYDIGRMFASAGLSPTTYCAHANLLDPAAPWRYGTPQIMKAIRAAAAMGLRYVITTEGDPKTPFGHGLTEKEMLFSIREKLYEPLRLAADCGITLLLEPHGRLTDSVEGMGRILEACGDPDHLGINLDTGNSWLGGADPIAFVRTFGNRIKHVHWKDLPPEMEAERGTRFGCGMSLIPLGTGAIDIRGVFEALTQIGFDGHTTLEVAGEQAVLESYEYLKALGAE